MPLAEPLQQFDRTFVRFRGRKLIYFGGCDYFRLGSHPAVLQAVCEGTKKFGVNVAASRLTTGNHPLFARLEKALISFFGVPSATLLSNGYVTNLAFAQSVAGEFTHALLDERAHGSLRDASQLLGCTLQAFRHRDAADLKQAIRRCGRRARLLVMTDGLFSHNGSLAPLPEYLAVLPPRATLLVDDTHGAGTLGKTGRGTVEVFGVSDARIVRSITLSKAFGVYGGAVLGSSQIGERIQERSRIFTGNTPAPLPLVHAALCSLKILKTDRSLRARLLANTVRVKESVRAAGLSVSDNAAPIVSVTPRDNGHAARLSRELLRAGIFPSLIRYTSGAAFFRFAISSEHTARQLDALTKTLASHA